MHAVLPHIPIAAQFGGIDYVVLCAYFLGSVTLGVAMGRGQSSLTDYFVAGRRMSWVLVAVSIIASDLSAISYMGTPAWIFNHDLKYPLAGVLSPLAFLIVVFLFVPLYHRLHVFTVYEYLERRFHPIARTVVALLFLFQRGVWLACALYIPSLAVATVADLPVVPCIVVTGFLTTLYTVKGGMKAVIWTDCLQFLVTMGGLIYMILMLLAYFHWDLADVWSKAGTLTGAETGTTLTTWIDWRMDFGTEGTIWSLLALYVIYNMGTYGTDQVIAQRYFTMGSYREIAKSILGSGVLNVAANLLLALFGLLLVVYYRQRPELAATLSRADQILPHFMANVLPVGFRGLVLAAILAATMSAVSAGLNSFATVGIMDLYKRHFRQQAADDGRDLTRARRLTFVLGALATAAAVWVSTRQTTIMQTAAAMASKFIGPITGIFLLGAITKRGNIVGLFAGVAVGLIGAFAIDWAPIARHVNWMWTAPEACALTLAAGYVVSLLVPVTTLRTAGTDAPVPVPLSVAPEPEVIEHS